MLFQNSSKGNEESALLRTAFTAQKMKLSMKDFFSKYDQIRSFLKKFLMENFVFCAALVT